MTIAAVTVLVVLAIAKRVSGVIGGPPPATVEPAAPLHSSCPSFTIAAVAPGAPAAAMPSARAESSGAPSVAAGAEEPALPARSAGSASPTARSALGERGLELSLEATLGHRADDLLGDRAVLEEDQRRDREDLVGRGRLLVLVGVELDDLQVVTLAVDLFEDRVDHTAGTA